MLLLLNRAGVWLLLFTPYVIAGSFFFPYITGKNFFFRIVVELVFGAWLALAAMNPRYRPRGGVVLWGLAAFIGVLLIATMLGVHPYQSFWSNFERMEGFITYIHLFALFLIASSIFETKRDWSVLFHVSLGVSVVISFYGFLEKIGVMTPPGASVGRVFSRLGNPIYLAAYLLFHFFILGLLWSWTKNIWARGAYLIIGLFEFYIFLSTGTRGAVVGLLAGVLAALLVYAFFSSNTKVRWATLGMLVLVVVTVLSLFQFKNTALVKSSNLLTRLTDISLTSSTGFSRVTIWNMAWEAFEERPILGWGPGNFIIPYAKYYNPDLYGNEPWFDRVHNMHLEWLVAGGILGFLAYVSLFAASGFVIWRLWRAGVLGPLESAALAGFLVAYLVQNTFVFDNVITYLFLILVLAFLHAMHRSYTFKEDQLVPAAPSSSGNTLFLAAFFMVLSMFAAYSLNAAPMKSAKGIISVLNAAGAGNSPIEINRKLDKVLELGTFGVSEARERFVDMVIQASQNSEFTKQAGFELLLNKAISEMEQEVEANPTIAKEFLPLGKLYQLRFAFRGDPKDGEKSLATYRKALELAPRYPSLRIGMAETYLTARDFTQATETVDSIFRQVQRPNMLVYSVLLVSVITEDFDRAVEQIAHYRSLGNTPTYQREAYFEPEKIEEVIQRSFASKNAAGREKFLLAALEGIEGKKNYFIFFAIAETKSQLGKKDEARTYAEQALAVAPDEYKPELEEYLQGLK